MVSVDTIRGRTALIIATSSAMIEYGAMPLWVGVLMGHYELDPKQAGLLVSLYLFGAVVSGFITAPIFGRIRSGRAIATTGLCSASLVFLLIAKSDGYSEMMLLHALGGMSIGPVLAVSQGTTGLSSNPHKLFAMTAVAASLCAAGFLAVMPSMVAKFDGTLFFNVVAAIFAVGALISFMYFPIAVPRMSTMVKNDVNTQKFPREVWFALLGLGCMAVVYTMTMSFVERVGIERNYSLAVVSTVLTVMAIAKLFPAGIAGLLEKHLQIGQVLVVVPLVQALACIAIFAMPIVAAYAIAGPIFITTLLFAQVFAFGLISKLEPTGKATALCPSIMMIGSGIGPFLGGSIVKSFGYLTLAPVGAAMAACAIFFFTRTLRNYSESKSLVIEARL